MIHDGKLSSYTKHMAYYEDKGEVGREFREALLKLEQSETPKKSSSEQSDFMERLKALADMHRAGELSDAEYEAAKRKLLA